MHLVISSLEIVFKEIELTPNAAWQGGGEKPQFQATKLFAR
jgi:hypothetical protein